MKDLRLSKSMYLQILNFVDTLPDAQNLSKAEKELIISFFCMCLSLRKKIKIV